MFRTFLYPSSGAFHCTHSNGICHTGLLTVHVSDSSSVHHQEFFTVHTAMVYVMQLASRIRMELWFRPDPARKLSANLYEMYHCCVYSEKVLMMDRGTVRNMESLQACVIYTIAVCTVKSS